MIAWLIALAVLGATTTTHTDTRISVRPGTRLELNDFGGSISVEAWSDNVVRVSADHSANTRIQTDTAGPVLGLSAVSRHGIPTSVEYHLTVPKWMSLDLSGVNTEISVENVEGEISVETVQGDVSITGGNRIIKASSVEGDVRVFRASGKIEATSVNADVRIEGCRGQVDASSINGEVRLKDVRTDAVEVSTISGEVSFEGPFQSGGSYRLNTHDGDLSVVIPDGSNVTVSVATHAGELSSTFPLKLAETARDGRFNLTLGNGSARMYLESFQGEIRLRRPGDIDTKHGNEFRYDYKYKYDTKYKYDYKYDYQYNDSKAKEKAKEKAREKAKSKDKDGSDPDQNEDHQP